jgi:hypothetical protein
LIRVFSENLQRAQADVAEPDDPYIDWLHRKGWVFSLNTNGTRRVERSGLYVTLKPFTRHGFDA